MTEAGKRKKETIATKEGHNQVIFNLQLGGRQLILKKGSTVTRENVPGCACPG